MRVAFLAPVRGWPLQKGRVTFEAGTRWSLGWDSDISFWFDSWTSEGPLRNLLHGLLTREEEVLRVGDVATDFGWNWGKISMELPAKIYMEIKAMPHSRMSDEKDKLIWAATSNGEFNLASAYKLATSQADFVPPFNGSWIWKLNLPPKIQTFIWMCMHKSVATRECLAIRGLQINPSCPLCHQYPESILHLLRDCPIASNVWHNLNPPSLTSTFFSQDLHTWLEANCNLVNNVTRSSVPWHTLFSFAIWTIWNHCNKVVFQN